MQGSCGLQVAAVAGLPHNLLERAAAKSRGMLINTEHLLMKRQQAPQQQQQQPLYPNLSITAATRPPVSKDVLGAGEVDVAQRLAAVIVERGTGGHAGSEEQQEEVMCLWQWLQEWKLHG